MNTTLRDIIAAGSLAIGLVATTGLSAQTARQPNGTTTTTSPTRPPAADATRDQTAIVDANSLEAGANSFTEGQVRSRLEAAGLTDVQGLTKNENGIWTGRAMRGGTSSEVAMDFRGRIAAGTGVAALATRSSTRAGTTGTGTSTMGTATTGTSATGTSTMGTSTGSNASGGVMPTRPDGTPGNPPSTVTGRAVDRLQGETPRPDGTPGNPSGTAAGRAVDRTLGTNTTGANPPAATPTR